MKILKILLVGLGIGSLGTISLSAATIGLSGTFDLSGRITVTQDAGTGMGHILWDSDIAPFTHDMFTLSGSSLNFNGVNVNENGQNVIHDLNNPPQIVGASFPNFDFIDFQVVPGLPSLLINFINNGAFAAHGCDNPTGPAASGQVCTLPGSPFGFVNSLSGGVLKSTAQFNFSGVTSDFLSAWTAVYSVNFDGPYQNVIAPFLNPTGAANSGQQTYAGSVVITITSLPEPNTMALLGGAMILGSLFLRRRVRAR